MGAGPAARAEPAAMNFLLPALPRPAGTSFSRGTGWARLAGPPNFLLGVSLVMLGAFLQAFDTAGWTAVVAGGRTFFEWAVVASAMSGAGVPIVHKASHICVVTRLRHTRIISPPTCADTPQGKKNANAQEAFATMCSMAFLFFKDIVAWSEGRCLDLLRLWGVETEGGHFHGHVFMVNGPGTLAQPRHWDTVVTYFFIVSLTHGLATMIAGPDMEPPMSVEARRLPM